AGPRAYPAHGANNGQWKQPDQGRHGGLPLPDRQWPTLALTRRGALLLPLALAACGPGGVSGVAATTASPAASPQHPAPTVRAAWADVGVPSPFRVSTAGPGGPVLLTLLYDTLTWKDEHGIIPWLATKWRISPDGREYTFTIAPNVQWHDGRPLTADDVAFTFAYYAQHPYRWTSTAMVASATVSAADQVVVRLRQPFAPFLEEIGGIVPIIPKHVWSQVADPLAHSAPDATLGSGPFALAEYRQAEAAYRLTANLNYFRGPVSVGEYQQLNISAQTSIQAVQKGELDLAWTTDASVVGLFPNDPRLKVLPTPPLSVVRLAVNTKRPPLDRKEVRQAIRYALDRRQIGQVITKGTPIAGSAGVIPPETPWFNPNLPGYAFDPAKARALLQDQRYSIELLADPTNREPELMLPMLQAVGIDLVVKRVDSQTRTQLLREGNFQLGIVQHIGIGSDPDFLRLWYNGAEANDFAQGFNFKDPQFGQLADAEAVTLDMAKRRAIIFRMQEILADQLPTIVLYYRRFYWVYDSAKYTPMTTWGGLIDGAPLVQNKLSFLRR
ncbi:MAG: ABC transporter substrate-binding protein, partial [Chloroflexota bacterium]